MATSNYPKVKVWRAENPDKVNEQARRYRRKHPETNLRAKAKYRAANLDAIRVRDRLAKAEDRKRNPEAHRTRMDRYLLRQEQKRVEIAGRPRPIECDLCLVDAIGPICFDHCHVSHQFRGWLCDRCNKVLGLVKDSAELLERMGNYLEHHHAKHHY